MTQFYLGVFTTEGKRVLVSIPDVEYVETFGDNFEEAFENAVDALAGCLAVGKNNTKPKSSMKKLKKKYPKADIIPVPVDANIIKSYEKNKRVNIVMSETLLKTVDDYRNKSSMNRSELLSKSVVEFMEQNPVE